jgi:hypothetical protein
MKYPNMYHHLAESIISSSNASNANAFSPVTTKGLKRKGASEDCETSAYRNTIGLASRRGTDMVR